MSGKYQESQADDVGSTVTDPGYSASQIGMPDITMMSFDGLDADQLVVGHSPSGVYSILARARQLETSEER